jgi:hypothetical protein
MQRRVFLKTGLGTAAVATLPHGRSFAFGSTFVAAPELVIVDSRFPQARAFGKRTSARGVETLFIAGDLTKLWAEDLDLRWRTAPMVTCGMTTAGALHCLQLLGSAYRMRIQEQSTIETPALPDPLVSWVLAPLPKATEIF